MHACHIIYLIILFMHYGNLNNDFHSFSLCCKKGKKEANKKWSLNNTEYETKEVVVFTILYIVFACNWKNKSRKRRVRLSMIFFNNNKNTKKIKRKTKTFCNKSFNERKFKILCSRNVKEDIHWLIKTGNLCVHFSHCFYSKLMS